MKISGIHHVPVRERTHAAHQAHAKAPQPSATPQPAEQPSMDEQLAKSVKKVGARIAQAVDSGALSTRQAQALVEVQQDFEKQMGRLADAMHGEKASRHHLNDGMAKVYGNLRESLGAILSASKATPFDALHASSPFDRGGLAIDVQG